jgi:hypothetical protein
MELLKQPHCIPLELSPPVQDDAESVLCTRCGTIKTQYYRWSERYGTIVGTKVTLSANPCDDCLKFEGGEELY